MTQVDVFWFLGMVFLQFLGLLFVVIPPLPHPSSDKDNFNTIKGLWRHRVTWVVLEGGE